MFLMDFDAGRLGAAKKKYAKTAKKNEKAVVSKSVGNAISKTIRRRSNNPGAVFRSVI